MASSSTSGSDTSKKCPGLQNILPNWVSSWKRFHVEHFLHIHYEERSSGLSEILKKIPKMKPLSSLQKKFIEILKSTNFGPGPMHLMRCAYNHDIHTHTINLVEEAKAQLMANNPFENNPSFSFHHQATMYAQIVDYLNVLGAFINAKFNKVNAYSDSEKEGDSQFKTPFICEETYANIVSAFAAMCGLRVERGSTDNRSTWEHFRGMDKPVISKPDLRFYFTGTEFSCANRKLLTVIEVKTNGNPTEEGKLKRKQLEDSEMRSKRRRYTVCYSSSSSDVEHDADAYNSWTLEKCSPKTKKVTPILEFDVGGQTLGQHAGELLLDLHTYMKKCSDVHRPSVLTMPGMIVDKTMVYFTLLEISYHHYEKLAGDKELTEDDTATIYYSPPYSIIDSEDRCLLMETFVALNNMETIFK